ncbi:Hint domain-containing protein [Phaeobacter sp. C3_T13_0]|uniref:Hint domain-containing protein n=1 Tax=Phaeobacter cretensis TaxID=3342641 RepID=UPI0039BCD9B6
METGFRGTYVISWGQTEVDGLLGAPVSALSAGSTWRWRGKPLRVDGPGNLLQLDRSTEDLDLRRRAARTVGRLVGLAVKDGAEFPKSVTDGTNEEALLRDRHFIVTNGLRNYTVTLIEVGQGQRPLLMFVDSQPPSETDLWVGDVRMAEGAGDSVQSTSGVICFTPGTVLRTPSGGVRVERLQEGDWIQTRDSGAQQIQWIGARRMSGARLFVAPELRPIRIRGGALGMQRPDADLLVSPGHRMLLRGPHVQNLFNTPEVLVAARDLINGRDIAVDTQLREVTYIHVLLSDHQVLWANGVETESFHPAQAALSALRNEDRVRLLQVLPELDVDPLRYGDFARRNINQPEAAILRHAAA